ncbi:hypothetical protein BaRGS_00023973, partial [Batillaria attramentaria]
NHAHVRNRGAAAHCAALKLLVMKLRVSKSSRVSIFTTLLFEVLTKTEPRLVQAE